MKFTYVTLFENLISPYFEDSILKRAIEKKLLSIEFYNPRDYTTNKHNKVDDYQAGGGAGLLLNAQPLFDTLKEIKKQNPNAHFVFPAPAGKTFVQADAKRLAMVEHIVFVNGRYEGIDERVIETYADEIFSIGDYVLTGGELPAMVIADAVSRFVPGVIEEKSVKNDSFNTGLLDFPHYTRPREINGFKVPEVLFSGNHNKVEIWRRKMALKKTMEKRPDLFLKKELDITDKKALLELFKELNKNA